METTLACPRLLRLMNAHLVLSSKLFLDWVSESEYMKSRQQRSEVMASMCYGLIATSINGLVVVKNKKICVGKLLK